MRQFDHLHIPITAVSLYRWFKSEESLPEVIVNTMLLDSLVELLRKQNGGVMPNLTAIKADRGYVTFTVSMTQMTAADVPGGDIFAPTTVDNIPFLIMRQTVRDISEITKRRGCGIWMSGKDITIRLPEYKHKT